MKDSEMVALLWRRREDGIEEIFAQYGGRLRALAAGIVGQALAEECVDDALLRAWNAIPPEKPTHLLAYLCKLTRNVALSRYTAETAQKRGGKLPNLPFSELAECLPGGADPARQVEQAELAGAINRFLRAQRPRNRQIFLARYFYAMPLREIAARFAMREGAVKSALRRTREALRAFLEKEYGA